MNSKVVAASLASVLVTGLPLLSGPAQAAPALVPQSQCGNHVFYRVHNKAIYFKQAKGKYSSVAGDPGVTLGISKSRTFTISGSITSTVDVQADVVFAKVGASVGVTVGGSYSGQSEISGSWTVPHTRKYRNGGVLSIGTRKYKGVIRKFEETGSCNNKLIWKAYYNLPQQRFYFHHAPVA